MAGTLRTLGHAIETCSLCSSPLPVHDLTSVEAAPAEGLRSERADICPECGRILAQGDQPNTLLHEEQEPN
jgi:hypothetical protein